MFDNNTEQSVSVNTIPLKEIYPFLDVSVDTLKIGPPPESILQDNRMLVNINDRRFCIHQGIAYFLNDYIGKKIRIWYNSNHGFWYWQKYSEIIHFETI